MYMLPLNTRQLFERLALVVVAAAALPGVAAAAT